jgi:hypothetical protein
MFITKTALPRRTFLKGTGVALALPFLDAMVPAATALAQTAAKPTMRFGAVYVPQGAIMDRWTPSTTGSDFAFSPILKPLEPFRDDVVVVSGLGNTRGDGGHAPGPNCFLSGRPGKLTETADISLGVTIDQVIRDQRCGPGNAAIITDSMGATIALKIRAHVHEQSAIAIRHFYHLAFVHFWRNGAA